MSEPLRYQAQHRRRIDSRGLDSYLISTTERFATIEEALAAADAKYGTKRERSFSRAFALWEEFILIHDSETDKFIGGFQ